MNLFLKKLNLIKYMNFIDYENNGFYFPLKVISENESLNICNQLENLVNKSDIDINKIYSNPNYLIPDIYNITISKIIINCVETLIGENIYVLEAVLFVKEPYTDDFISWHQDLTYWGFDSDRVVTAWVSLNGSNQENGCMRFIIGSQNEGIVDHKETYEKNNMLSRGQVIKDKIDESKSIIVKLNPGEMSLHHGKLFHSSERNKSKNKRVGLAIRYISSDIKHQSGHKFYSHHISGKKNTDIFISTPPPKKNISIVDLKIVDLKENIMKRIYNKNI